MGKMEARIGPVPVKIREKLDPLDQTTWPVRVNRVMGGGKHRLSVKDRSSQIVVIEALCGRIYPFPASRSRRPKGPEPRWSRAASHAPGPAERIATSRLCV